MMGKETDKLLENAMIANPGRRRVVKKMVVSAGVLASYSVIPEKWTAPFVGQVALPAHAQTSIEEIVISVNDPCTVTLVEGLQDSEQVVVNISGYVFPATEGLTTSIVVTPNPYNEEGIETVFTTTNVNGEFSATVTLTTDSGIGTVLVVTTVVGAEGEASCRVDVPEPIYATVPDPREDDDPPQYDDEIPQ